MKVVGVPASPKHITAVAGNLATHALVALVSVADMVCATVPVPGGESARSPTDKTRFARAFDTRLLRTFTEMVSSGASSFVWKTTEDSASPSGARTCG